MFAGHLTCNPRRARRSGGLLQVAAFFGNLLAFDPNQPMDHLLARELPARRLWLFYIGGLAAALGLFMGVSWIGERATGGGPSVPVAPGAKSIDTMLHVLLALAVVIVTARVIGALFHYLHQPPVIGEVVGGILLGPSLLGLVSPAAYAFLLPSQAAPFLSVIAQLGASCTCSSSGCTSTTALKDSRHYPVGRATLGGRGNPRSTFWLL